MPVGKLDIPDFAAKIKEAHPEYKDVNDTVLTNKIIEKYPQYRDRVNLPGESKVDKGIQQTSNSLAKPLEFNGTFKPDLEGEKNGLYLNDPEYQKQKADFTSRILTDDKGYLVYPEKDDKSGQWLNYYTKQPLPAFRPEEMHGKILQVPHEYLPATKGNKFISPVYNKDTNSYEYPGVQEPILPHVQDMPEATVYGTRNGATDESSSLEGLSPDVNKIVEESKRQKGQFANVLMKHPSLAQDIDATLKKYGPQYAASVSAGSEGMENVLQKTVEDKYGLNKPLPNNIDPDVLNGHLNVLNNFDKNRSNFEAQQQDLQRQADLLTDKAKKSGQPVPFEDADRLAKKAASNIAQWNNYAKSVDFAQKYVQQPDVKDYIDQVKNKQEGIHLLDEIRQRSFPEHTNAQIKQDEYDRKAIEGNLTLGDYLKTFAGKAGQGISNILETVAKTGAAQSGIYNPETKATIEGANNKIQQFLGANLPSISPEAFEQISKGKGGLSLLANDIASTLGGFAPYIIPGAAGEGMAGRLATFSTALAEGLPTARKEAEKEGLTGSAYNTYIAAKPVINAAFMSLLPNAKFAEGAERDLAKSIVDGEFSNVKTALLNLAPKMLKDPSDIAHLQAMLSGTAIGDAVVNQVSNVLQAKDDIDRGITRKQALPVELSNVFNPKQTAVMALAGKILEAVPTLKNTIGDLKNGKEIAETYNHIQNNVVELAANNLEGVSRKVEEMVKKDPGNIYAQHLKTTLEDFAHAEARMPEGITPEQKAALFGVQRKIEQLKRQMSNADPVYQPHIQKNIDELNKQVPEILKDENKANDYLKDSHKNFSDSILSQQEENKENQKEGESGSEAISKSPSYLVSRHADTIKDEEGKVSGPNQHPLSEKGKKDANDLANEVAEKAERTGIPITKIVHSGLERSAETANTVANKVDARTVRDPDLNTWAIGEFDNFKDEEFKEVQKWFVQHPNEKVYEGPLEQAKGKSLDETFNEYANRTIDAHKKYENEPKSTLLIDHSNNMMIMDAYRKNGGKWDEKAANDYLNAEKPEPATLVKENKPRVSVSTPNITNVKLKKQPEAAEPLKDVESTHDALSKLSEKDPDAINELLDRFKGDYSIASLAKEIVKKANLPFERATREQIDAVKKLKTPKDVLKHIIDNTTDDSLKKAASVFLDNIDKAPFLEFKLDLPVDRNGYPAGEGVLGSYAGGKMNVSERAFWQKHTNYFDKGLDGGFKTILHEFTHVFTVDAYRNPKNKPEREFRNYISKTFKELKANSEFADQYGFTSPEEFISEVISNPEFRLSAPIYKSGILDKIIEFFAKMFGYTKDKDAESDARYEKMKEAFDYILKKVPDMRAGEGKKIFYDKDENLKKLAEAYHKSKADGSNPELVKALEGLFGRSDEKATKEKTSQDKKKETAPPKQDEPEDSPIVNDDEEDEFTSTKNEITRQKIEDAGLDHPMKEAAREFGDVWKQAQKKINKGFDIEKLIKTLGKKPRAVTDLENAMILFHQGVKEAQLAEASKDLDAARKSGNRDEWNDAYNRRAKLLDELQDIYNVDKAVGRETARGLNARKMMADRKFSLINMQMEKTASKGGEPLTDAEREEVQKQYEEIKKTKDAYEKRIEELEKENARLSAEKEVKSASKSTKSRKTKAEFKAERKDIIQRMREDLLKAAKGGEGLTSSVPFLAQLKAIAPHVKDLVKSFVEEGVNNLEDITKNIKDILSPDMPDLEDRHIHDLIAGEYDSKEQGEEPKELTEAQQRRKDINTKVKETKEAAKVQKFRANDPQLLKLQAEYERAKDKFEQDLKKSQLKTRATFQKIQDEFLKYERFDKLSNPITLGKLAMAAITRLSTTPIEEGVGAVYSKALPSIAKNAPGEAGFHVKALAKGYTSAFMQGLEDAARVVKGDKSDLEAVYGKKGHLPPEAIDFFGQLHSAIKAPVKRFAFERSFQKRMANNIKNGTPIDSMVEARIAMEAYKDAQRSIFMQDNAVSKGWSMLVNGLERSDTRGAKELATTLQWLIPFVKVPTNIVGETISHVAGPEIALAKIIRSGLKEGLDKLSQDDAESILRNLKKGTIGHGALILGYLNPKAFGGYYQEKEKRAPGDLKAGQMRLFGHAIPAWMLEAPIFQAMQLGATVRRVKDKVVKGQPQGIGEGIWAGALGLLEHEPLIDEPIRMGKMLASPQERQYFIGELAKSTLVPSILDYAAKVSDPADKRPVEEKLVDPENKRKPETIVEHIETGIPGLREKVGEKKPASSGHRQRHK